MYESCSQEISYTEAISPMASAINWQQINNRLNRNDRVRSMDETICIVSAPAIA